MPKLPPLLSDPAQPSLAKRLAWSALLYCAGVAAVALIAACFHFLIAAVPP